MHGKTILLVEAEQAIRDRLRATLSKNGYEVVEANNGAEGFTVFRSRPFDLVITDSDLPFIDGDELACLMKRSNSAVPILMLSERRIVASSANPIDATLYKGVIGSRLLEVTASLLASQDEMAPFPDSAAGSIESQSETVASEESRPWNFH